MLGGIGLRFNLPGCDVLSCASGKRGSEDREQPVSFQTAKAFCCFHHARCRPAERHCGTSPSLHLATDATHRPHHVLDRVGAGERAPQLCRELQATVNIASSPSRMLAATPGTSWSSLRARLRSSRSGLVGICEPYGFGTGAPHSRGGGRVGHLVRSSLEVARAAGIRGGETASQSTTAIHRLRSKPDSIGRWSCDAP